MSGRLPVPPLCRLLRDGLQFNLVRDADQVRVGADIVGEFHVLLELGLAPARHGRGQHRHDGEADIVLAVGEAHLGTDLGPLGQLLALLAGGSRHGAEEAGGIADREQLLGIGARTVVAAHRLGNGKFHRHLAVVSARFAASAAAMRCSAVSGIENLGHLPMPCRMNSEWGAANANFDCAQYDCVQYIVKEMPMRKSMKLDDQLCFSIYAASHAFTRFYKPLLGPLGLTYPQYLVLLTLWEGDGLPLKAIGERLGLDSGTLTPLLRRMDEAGLLTRARDAAA